MPCEGGPCLSRLEYFPPKLEIEERGGTYVLVDEGQLPDWRYLFVPTAYRSVPLMAAFSRSHTEGSLVSECGPTSTFSMRPLSAR